MRLRVVRLELGCLLQRRFSLRPFLLVGVRDAEIQETVAAGWRLRGHLCVRGDRVVVAAGIQMVGARLRQRLQGLSGLCVRSGFCSRPYRRTSRCRRPQRQRQQRILPCVTPEVILSVPTPSFVAVIAYCPDGSPTIRNSPLPSVLAVRVSDTNCATNVTTASATGLPVASITLPRTSGCATAGAAANTMSAAAASTERIKWARMKSLPG